MVPFSPSSGSLAVTVPRTEPDGSPSITCRRKVILYSLFVYLLILLVFSKKIFPPPPPPLSLLVFLLFLLSHKTRDIMPFYIGPWPNVSIPPSPPCLSSPKLLLPPRLPSSPFPHLPSLLTCISSSLSDWVWLKLGALSFSSNTVMWAVPVAVRGGVPPSCTTTPSW